MATLRVVVGDCSTYSAVASTTRNELFKCAYGPLPHGWSKSNPSRRQGHRAGLRGVEARDAPLSVWDGYKQPSYLNARPHRSFHRTWPGLAMAAYQGQLNADNQAWDLD